MTKTIIGYKAMDKNMKCRDFQFEIGKEYEHDGDISMCGTGFHFCENSLDVLNYYPRDSRFFKISASGDYEKAKDKSVASKIKIECELTFDEMVKEFFANIKNICSDSKVASTSGKWSHANTSGDGSHANTSGKGSHANTSGKWSHANTSGDGSHANTSGYRAHANTSGDGSHANTSGYRAHANTSGYRAHANTSDKWAHANTSEDRAHANTSGDRAHANTSGDESHANTSGKWAHANTSGDESHANTSGKWAHATCSGIHSKSKVDHENGWLTIINWVFNTSDNEYQIKEICSACPGMKIHDVEIKTNVWYWFEDGEFKFEESE